MNNLVVVDIETTGFAPESKKGNKAGMTEVTGLLYDIYGNYLQAMTNSLCRPQGPQYIPKVIEELTGITWPMVKYMKTDRYVAQDLARNASQYCGENAIIVAHNAKFEKQFLSYYDNRFKGFRYFDTMALTMLN